MPSSTSTCQTRTGGNNPIRPQREGTRRRISFGRSPETRRGAHRLARTLPGRPDETSPVRNITALAGRPGPMVADRPRRAAPGELAAAARTAGIRLGILQPQLSGREPGLVVGPCVAGPAGRRLVRRHAAVPPGLLGDR